MIKVKIKAKICEAGSKKSLTAIQQHNVDLIMDIVRRQTSDKKELEEILSYYERLVNGIKPLKTKKLLNLLQRKASAKSLN